VNKIHDLIRRVTANNPNDVAAFVNANNLVDGDMSVTPDQLADLVIDAYNRDNDKRQFIEAFCSSVVKL
jgi:hypothetical protein